ncbi:hypothetical protein CEXT_595611 [Caerostris extrusa]|uniref:Uncharacterized protein n=1 Tax=Caerostris extrusa TaxID=172846 RepID=A0AAV4XZP1_CAEEX|nr:hypothetical protein CEXT_595611 [Caerostris extrusa]
MFLAAARSGLPHIDAGGEEWSNITRKLGCSVVVYSATTTTTTTASHHILCLEESFQYYICPNGTSLVLIAYFLLPNVFNLAYK